MTMDELKKAVKNKAATRKKTISKFDLDFLATMYLACLYEYKVEGSVPIVLNNITQLPIMGGTVVKNYDDLSIELQDLIPRSGVPTRNELDIRWIRNKNHNMMKEELKDRLQSLL